MVVQSVTLLATGAVTIVTGLAFLLVGVATSRKLASGPRLLARRAHTTWWLGLGAYLVLQGGLSAWAANGALTLDVYLASRVLAIPLLCAAVWGLSYYLVYLYSGSTQSVVPLATFFVGVMALFFYATFALPQQLIVEKWTVALDDTDPAYRLVYLAVGTPPIIASVAYLGLLRRVREAEQRYRITLIGASILLYVASGLVARLIAVDILIFITLVLLGLGAAAASVAAYYPPRRLKELLRRGSE